MKKYGLITVLLLTAIIIMAGCGNKGNNAGGDVISENEAKAIALEHADLSENEVTISKVKLEMDDGIQEYEIEFYTKNKEYDYNIDALTGEIRSFDNELESHGSKTPNSNKAAITVKDASALALKKVPGATEANLRIKEELEDGRTVYEGSILYENKQYDFQIDATTGEFIEWEID